MNVFAMLRYRRLTLQTGEPERSEIATAMENRRADRYNADLGRTDVVAPCRHQNASLMASRF